MAERLALIERGYEQQVTNGRMSPSTLAGYAKAIHGERMQRFVQGRAIGEVRPGELRAFIAEIQGTAKHVRNLLIPLRAAFSEALNDDLIESNPFDRIDLPALLRKTTRASAYVVDPFSIGERRKLLAAANAMERPLVQFWLNSGLRPGELIALKWSRITLDKRKARIDCNQVAGIEKAPKTAAGIRELDLTEHAIFALMLQRSSMTGDSDHVWLNPRSGGPWRSDAQLRTTLWRPLLQRADVRYRNPYQCRHTFASSLLTAGENPWYVAEQLGHADVHMVFNVYGKFIAQDYLRPKAMSSKPATIGPETHLRA